MLQFNLRDNNLLNYFKEVFGLNVSDRIAVMYEGKIVGIVDAKDADENTLGLMMAGGEDNE